MFLSIFKFSISNGIAIEGHRVENVLSLGLPCWVTSAPAVIHLKQANVPLPTMEHGQSSLLMSEIFTLLKFHLIYALGGFRAGKEGSLQRWFDPPSPSLFAIAAAKAILPFHVV